MVVEVGYPTGREATCKHCGEPITQTAWTWGREWGHEDGSRYCADAPQAEPSEAGESRG